MWNAVIHNQHQRTAQPRGGEPRWGMAAHSLVADEAQGGRCVPSVGGTAQSGPARLHDVVSLLNWPSAVATVARPLSLSLSIASRLPPSGRGDDRRADRILPGQSATHSWRFTSSRLQFHRIGYQPGSYVSDPFEHLERLSSVVGSMPNHDRSALAHVQIQLPRGKYV